MKYLAMYLPYEVEVVKEGVTEQLELCGINWGAGIVTVIRYYPTGAVEEKYFANDVKLKLKPLDIDLIRSLKCDKTTKLELLYCANKSKTVERLSYATVLFCLKNHIDIFNL